MIRKYLFLPTPITVVGLGLAVAICMPARADEQDTLNVSIGEGFAHDDNLFRLPAGVDPATLGLGKSARGDNIRTDTLSLTADKSYSLQHFHLGASYNNFHFSNYGFLNYNTKNVDGRWNWSLTPNITGVIGAERVQSFNNFADYQNYVRSVRTTDNLHANAEFGSIGALRFVAGVAESKSSSSTLVQQDGDTRTRSAQAGLRYVSAAENSIGYLFRENKVEWTKRGLDPINLYDTDARQTDHELNALWHIASQATLDGAIAHINRHHDTFGVRDYSGTNGRLNINWMPETRVRVVFGARRDYASWWTSTASYTVTDTFNIIPTWQFSEKITLRGRIEQSKRNFFGPVVATTQDDRHDKLNTAQIGLDWTPDRSLVIGTAVEKSRRSTNAPGLDFTDTTTSINAKVLF